jgi:hypothetical protein
VIGPSPKVMIGVLPDGSLEGIALRAVLEATGRSAELHFIATPEQFRQFLGPEVTPNILVICGHGADGHLYFGSLADIAGGAELADGMLPAGAFAQAIVLPGCTVLSTACDSGSEILAHTFLQGGAAAFIAPQGEPEGSDLLIAAHLVLNALLFHKLDACTATEIANKILPHAVTLTVRAGVAHAA